MTHYSTRKKELYPPKARQGRPPEPSHTPGSKGRHRSGSMESRTSAHSKRRYDHTSERDESSKQPRKPRGARSVFELVKHPFKSTTKKQPSMDTVGKYPQGFNKDSIDRSRSSSERVIIDESQRARPVCEPGQPTAVVTLDGVNADQLPSDSQAQQATSLLPENVPDHISKLLISDSEMDSVCEGQNDQFDNSKKSLPPPPAHEIQAMMVPEGENSFYWKRQYEATIKKQRETINGLKTDNAALSDQVQSLNQTISSLQKRVSAAASKNVNIPVRTPLNRPERELLKDWENLAFEVRNFVGFHFEKVNTNDLKAWAEQNGTWLGEVSQTYQQDVTGKQTSFAMIEAAIWYNLSMFVFADTKGNRPMRWAGNYERVLGTLVDELQKEHAKENSEQFIPMFHQWNTLTANMMATIQSDDSYAQQVIRLVKRFEDLFASCRPRKSRSDSYRLDLEALVSKAIQIDFWFSGQTSRYLVDWPHVGRHNMVFDKAKMRQDARSPESFSDVRFMIQPCLFGVNRQGEGYDSLVVLDKCVVWMF
ncbi:unnamed protein product [Fusarium graminearum]|uniref:Uncharacterized protein n=1 Tax=Gibberella zeae TaxID=5518 RepID=A0A9N8RD96_GIBZA|nr:unnamed protein product [Fusarium graminearum]